MPDLGIVKNGRSEAMEMLSGYCSEQFMIKRLLRAAEPAGLGRAANGELLHAITDHCGLLQPPQPTYFLARPGHLLLHLFRAGMT
jgi:hypothetical protein